MKKVQAEIRKTIRDYGKEIVKEKRLVYILSDYGVLKELYAERRILLNMIEDGYTELILDFASHGGDASLKICSYVSEMHNKYGYQIRKLVTVFSWIIEGLGMPAVPFDAILRISNETEENIKEIIIKGKFEIKDPKSEIAGYKMPGRNLLSSANIPQYDHSQILSHIHEVFEKYHIDIDNIDIKESPAMLFLDVQLASTIRLTKLQYLNEEIANALAQSGCRLIVPIPGTSHIGIEYPVLPQSYIQPSHSFEMSEKLGSTKGNILPCLLGLQPNGNPISFDLSKENHALISGIQGSGKSNCIHSIIQSLIFHKHPSQVKFCFVDIKNVEYNIYRQIANNFLADYSNGNYIVSSEEQASIFFRNIIKELEFRQSLLSLAATSRIEDYNAKYMVGDLNPKDSHIFLPFLVIIIDELSDLANVNNITQSISSLVKIGPEVGIHIIAASRSRFKRNLLPEEIRNGFKVRISFKQDSSIDSKAIIDSPDATRLLPYADALFMDSILTQPIRFTCSFFDQQEKSSIADYIALQPAYKLPYKLHQYSDSTSKVFTTEEEDLYSAASIFVKQGKCSESILQKELSYTFNRAHRIILHLEEIGIVRKENGIRIPSVSSIPELQAKLSSITNT